MFSVNSLTPKNSRRDEQHRLEKSINLDDLNAEAQYCNEEDDQPCDKSENLHPREARDPDDSYTRTFQSIHQLLQHTNRKKLSPWLEDFREPFEVGLDAPHGCAQID